MRRLKIRLIAVLLLAAAHARAHADLSKAIDQIKPSVVAVGTFAETDSPRFTFHGTGFVVGRGNMVVSNSHVVPEVLADRRIQVLVLGLDGARSSRTATVMSRDLAHDLVLLQFDGPAVPAVTLATSGAARDGVAIGLMGFPLGGALGFTPVTHRGIVSAVTPIALPLPNGRTLNERALRQLREGPFDILQLDATAYPGNSGGPVFDAETGAVLGVINMVLVKGSKESALSQPSGISYAIPAAFVRQLMDSR